MIGLDTNILVRYITQDHPEQSGRAVDLLESRCTKESPGVLALVVLCELVWVLRGAYGYKKSAIIQVMEQILVCRELEVKNYSVAFSALAAYKKGSADFADYVIAFANQDAGCEATFSFDQKLAKLSFVERP